MVQLNDPLKLPYIAVYSPGGIELANSFGDGDITVTYFSYEFSDEEDDSCEIRMQSSEPWALNRFNIGRGSTIRIKWGYRGGPDSPSALVVIKDLKSKYGNNVIYTTLECGDYASYLKVTRSPDIIQGSFLDYLKAQASDKYKVIIKDRGKPIYLLDKKKANEKDQQLLNTDQDYSFDPFIYDYEGYIDNLLEEALQNNDREKIVENEESDPVLKYLQKTISIPSSNRTIFVVLQDLLKKCPYGPWYVTGRGDTILIHNRNLDRDLYKSYKYKDEPGLLIDFVANTKYDNFEKQTISYSGMDADERKNYYIDDYRKALSNMRPIKEILNDKEITKEQAKKEIDEILALRKTGWYKFGVERTHGVFYAKYDKVVWSQFGDFLWEGTQKVQDWQRNGQDLANLDLFSRDAYRNATDADYTDPVQRAYWYTIPLLTYEESVAVTNNRMRELEMDKEEGTLILEGDPWLMDNHVVEVTNVHEQHEGRYYVKKCKHTLSQQGYKTTLSGFKIVPEAAIQTMSNFLLEDYDEATEDVKAIIEKQYKREQKIFNTDVGLKYQKSANIGTAGYGTVGVNISTRDQEELKISQLFDPDSEYTTDEWLEKYYELRDKGAITFEDIELDPEIK